MQRSRLILFELDESIMFWRVISELNVEFSKLITYFEQGSMVKRKFCLFVYNLLKYETMESNETNVTKHECICYYLCVYCFE